MKPVLLLQLISAPQSIELSVLRNTFYLRKEFVVQKIYINLQIQSNPVSSETVKFTLSVDIIQVSVLSWSS